MKIAVLGTGTVGRALASGLAALGHDVTVGTRDVAATLSRATEESGDAPPWGPDAGAVGLASFSDAAAAAELVVNATTGQVSLDALGAAGAANLSGKTLMDVSNPLDFSQGFPPTLFVKDTDSLAERIQAAFPQAKVVKTLNTLTAALMINPASLAEGDHSVFVSGNDAEAKQQVTELLHAMGHTDVIDLGDITTARGVEMWLPLWLRVMGVLGTAQFNLKIVR